MRPCHLPRPATNTPHMSYGQAYRLTEGARGPLPPHDGTPESTLRILAALDVEHGARWRPNARVTYCNVYAHDVCDALGAYLPRVWWARDEWAEDDCTVAPVYQRTVNELSANALCRWLERMGTRFSWRRAESLDDAQSAANRGLAVVISARRTIETQPGHVSIVAPESARCRASRHTMDDGAAVIALVQSQAGGRNEELAVARPWWRGAEFSAFGMWVHGDDAGTKEVQPTHPDTAATPIRIERDE